AVAARVLVLAQDSRDPIAKVGLALARLTELAIGSARGPLDSALPLLLEGDGLAFHAHVGDQITGCEPTDSFDLVVLIAVRALAGARQRTGVVALAVGQEILGVLAGELDLAEVRARRLNDRLAALDGPRRATGSPASAHRRRPRNAPTGGLTAAHRHAAAGPGRAAASSSTRGARGAGIAGRTFLGSSRAVAGPGVGVGARGRTTVTPGRFRFGAWAFGFAPAGDCKEQQYPRDTAASKANSGCPQDCLRKHADTLLRGSRKSQTRTLDPFPSNHPNPFGRDESPDLRCVRRVQRA